MAVAVAGVALADAKAERTTAAVFAAIPAADAGAITRLWADLASRAVDDNAFFHPDFVIPAVAATGDAVSIAGITDPIGRLDAVAPFTRTRLGRIAPAVRLWAHKYAPLGAPLVAAGALDAGVAALVEGLAPEGSGRSVIVPDLPIDSSIARALVRLAQTSGRPLSFLDAHERAMLKRSEAGADLRAGLAGRRRKELGRQMRRMEEIGAVSLVSMTKPEGVRAGFEEFLALEKAGWKGREGSALASSPGTAAFGRTVIGARPGGARIDMIRVGARPVAIVVTLIAGATAWTWKIAYDEPFARFSPGAQLMLEAPARIFADRRVQRIDSCAVADHPMIDRLWPERLPIATLVLGPSGGGALHKLGLAAARAEIAARAKARQLRDRYR
jgi:CelD/BcsL family acetyltransferase involved in cellulose biosynthesis